MFTQKILEESFNFKVSILILSYHFLVKALCFLKTSKNFQRNNSTKKSPVLFCFPIFPTRKLSLRNTICDTSRYDCTRRGSVHRTSTLLNNGTSYNNPTYAKQTPFHPPKNSQFFFKPNVSTPYKFTVAYVIFILLTLGTSSTKPECIKLRLFLNSYDICK